MPPKPSPDISCQTNDVLYFVCVLLCLDDLLYNVLLFFQNKNMAPLQEHHFRLPGLVWEDLDVHETMCVYKEFFMFHGVVLYVFLFVLVNVRTVPWLQSESIESA